MTIEDTIELLTKRITYKPGWTIRVTSDTWNKLLKVSIFFRAPHIRENREVSVGNVFTLTDLEVDMLKEEELVRKTLRWIKQLEEHETYEWFKLDKVAWVNPHPELKFPIKEDRVEDNAFYPKFKQERYNTDMYPLWYQSLFSGV